MLPGVRKRVFNFHDVLMYVAIARKHLRLMVLLMCFAWLAGLVYYVYARPIYYSRSLVKANQIKQQISAEKDFNEAMRLGGVMQELKAPHIVANTAAKLGVRKSYRDLMKYYIKDIKVRKNSEDNIEVEVYPYSYDWAKRWTETMVREYLDYRQQRRIEEMRERLETYQRQREELLKMLEEKNVSVSEARAVEGYSGAKIAFDTIRDLHPNLVRVKKRLDALGRVRVELLDPNLSVVEKLSRISNVLEPLPVGAAPSSPLETSPLGTVTAPGGDTPAANPSQVNVQVITPALASAGSSWHAAEREWQMLEARKQELLDRGLLEGHQRVRALQQEIEVVKGKLDGELATATQRLATEFNILLDEQKRYNEQLPHYNEIYAKYLESQQKDDIAKSGLAPIRTLLQGLERSIQTSEIAYDNDRIELSYAGWLEINESPVSPNRLSLAIYTTLLGLLMALGIPFLVEYLDHTLSNLEQVESAFHLRGLGIVPKVSNADHSVALLDSPEAKEQNLLENFRVIRTNLLSMGALSKQPHVTMITSAMPKEGKTVISTNLALSFAQTGAKTVLVDTDLRRGRLHRFFGYRKQPGLSGVLLGQCTLDEAIRPTPHENMFIISAGQHLETGTELLGSARFHEVMAELRKRFDRVVLDTPPVLGLSETSVLQNQVDGVLFVIWSGYTPIKSVKAAVEMLQANGANFYGFVLNRLDLNATANYYQYYYYSHDYYYQYSPRSLENV